MCRFTAVFSEREVNLLISTPCLMAFVRNVYGMHCMDLSPLFFVLTIAVCFVCFVASLGNFQHILCLVVQFFDE